MSMSATRFRQISQGQTAIAMRVYEAIPISAPMGVHQIRGEMKRLGIPTPTLDVMQGCIRTLIEGGLVKEQPAGQYAREPVKPEPMQQPRPILHAVHTTPKEEPMAQADAAKKNVHSPIDLLAPVVQQIKTMADVAAELVTRARSAANDIENIAADLEDKVSDPEELAKLRQLNNLLKGL